MLGLAGGVGGLELVGQTVVLLIGNQVVELLTKVKQRTGDKNKSSVTKYKQHCTEINYNGHKLPKQLLWSVHLPFCCSVQKRGTAIPSGCLLRAEYCTPGKVVNGLSA